MVSSWSGIPGHSGARQVYGRQKLLPLHSLIEYRLELNDRIALCPLFRQAPMPDSEKQSLVSIHRRESPASSAEVCERDIERRIVSGK